MGAGIGKANAEAQRLNQENPGGAPDLSRQHLSLRSTGTLMRVAFLSEHYERRILEGPKKGVPKQKSLNMEQAAGNPDAEGLRQEVFVSFRGHLLSMGRSLFR